MWVTEMSDATHAHRNRLLLTPTNTRSHTNYFRCRPFQASIFVFIRFSLSYFKSSVQLSATLCADTLSVLFIFTLKVHFSFNTSCLVQGKGGKEKWTHLFKARNNKTEIKQLLLKSFHWSADTFQHQGQLHCRQASDELVATGNRNDTSGGHSNRPLIYS